MIDWTYNNGSQIGPESKKGVTWTVVVPSDAAPVASFYNEAINKDAAHPAAARCWEEYVFSDAGQNTWLKGFAMPVRLTAMTTAGTIDKAALAAVNPPAAAPVMLTSADRCGQGAPDQGLDLHHDQVASRRRRRARMTEVTGLVPAPSASAAAGPASRGAGASRFKGARNYLALIPFHAYVGLFLVLPTLIVTLGAFSTQDGQPTVENLVAMFTTQAFIVSFIKSLQLAVITALLGAVFGGLLAWAVLRGDPNGILRQLVVAASGVLAQFGGVMLAFAFLATFGFNGLVTMFIQNTWA